MTSQVSRQAGQKTCSRVPSRGPRTVVIQKEGGGFGFTLRHFIVYPPDSIKKQPLGEPSSPSYSSESPWRGLSAQSESMDTIFVREVKEGSCAHLAGLVTGDRIITINKQPLTGMTYSQVIDLIQNSGNTLHLLVVPKEDDILQRYFSGSAYQPVDRLSSRVEGPSFIGGRERSSIASTSATEPIYARVRTRNSAYQQTPLDRSWPLRQPSGLQQCTSVSYPTNCRSLDCISNEAPIHPSNSIRPPSLTTYNTRSLSESEKSCYQSPRHSIAADPSRSHPFYTSHSQDGECKEALYSNTPGRPYKFHDTFSKLLIDMWYPQSKGLNHPVHHHNKPEHIYRMRDQGKPGLAGLFSKTMKAFLPPHENRSHEPWPEASNGFYGKQAKGGEYFDPCRETDILDSDSATDSEMPGSLNLVAHRLQQFESGSLQDRAQERTNMYRHEFSRVSSPNPCPIVQKRAAQFETLASPTKNDSKSHAQKLKELSDRVADNGFHPVTVPSSGSNETTSLSSSAYHFKPVHPPEEGNSGLPHYAGVTYRRKHFTDQDKHVARRISYLKATAGERMLVESDLTDEDEKKAMNNLIKRPSTECEGSEYKIDKLKTFFGEKTPKIRDAIDSSQLHQPQAGDVSEDDEFNDVLVADPTLTTRLEPTGRTSEPIRPPPPMMEGWLSCKLVFVQGKRSTDRSWRTVWALFRGSTLHLLRDKREPSSSSHEVSQSSHPLHNGSEIYDTSINLKTTFTSIAHDYTKRKHVLRLRLANGTEYLFQAESQVAMLEWLCTMKAAGLETEKEYLWHHASVLEKAAAYEQQIGLHSHIQSNGSNATTSTNRGAPAVISPGSGGKGGSGVKLPFRHRSPMGHTPAVKTRRASHGDELCQGPRLGSVLRGRVSGGWRKTHSLQSEVLPKGASVGVKLEECPLSLRNQYVPLLVDLCVEVVETQGLEMVGIFRVPGNNAAVSLLIDAVNQGALLPALSCPPSVPGISCLQDPRWKDVNVVSSLLKAFFRKLPEPLLTSGLYPKFINASKVEEVDKRLVLLRALLHQLPRHHYETLKFLIQHLKRVVDHSHINKMEARNLAIVFGPTLVRPSDSSMVALVTDMSHQCYIIETLINYVDWLFSEHFLEELPCELTAANRRMSHPLPISHSNMLLRNLQKLDQAEFSSQNSPSNSESAAATSKPPQEMFSRELLSSLMFASHRKHSNRRKEPLLATASSVPPSSNSSTPVSPLCSSNPCSPYNRNSLSSHSNRPSVESPLISSGNNDRGIAKATDNHDTGPLGDEVVHHTYDEINSLTQERIRRFEKETRALLRRDQPPKPSMNYNSKVSSAQNSLPASGAVNPSESDRRVEYQQIELEWQKAKRELEQDDLLDVVADDPSFLTYLLNRQEHSPPDTAMTSTTGYSSAPASLILTPQEGQMDRLSSSLEGSLQMDHNSSSPSSSSAKSSQRNSLQASLGSTSALRGWAQDPQDRRNPWRSPSASPSTHISTSDRKTSVEVSSSAEPSPTMPADNCQGKVVPPLSSSTNYTWNYTPSSKISQS